MSHLASEVNMEVSALFTSCQELASDTDLTRYAIASETYTPWERVDKITQLSGQLLRIKRFSPLVETAEILLPNLNRVVVTDRTIYDTMDQKEWDELSACLNGSTQAVGMVGEDLYLLCTYFYKVKPAFIISIRITPQNLHSRLEGMRSDTGTQLVLMRSDDGSIYGGSAAGRELQSLYESDPKRFQGRQPDYTVSDVELGQIGLRARGFKPTTVMVQPLQRLRLWILILTVVAAALLLVYLFYFRHFIMWPLNTIYESVRRAGETGHFHIDEEDPEFDDIYAQFNKMLAHIKDLAGQVYEERYRGQRAELRQLQMQINPHFFYNTLFMLYRMAKKEQCEEIAAVCLNMSSYYRYITNAPAHDVALSAEVEHIRNYLSIQEFRFSPRVSIRMEKLPPEIAAEKIPPLVLQPIVENAFTHGVKDKLADGLVEVLFTVAEDSFGVVVRDNGGEMDDEKVRRLDMEMRSDCLPEGSALYNLFRRMELIYGDRYSLELSCVDSSLQVSILFPRKEQKRDDDIADRG